jgi:exosome complex RNA-binding protein Rrp4
MKSFILDGHLKCVEKHWSGLTIGIGQNGKLWLLSRNQNTVLDSYRGPYVQTDELEINTYENQRWVIKVLILIQYKITYIYIFF